MKYYSGSCKVAVQEALTTTRIHNQLLKSGYFDHTTGVALYRDSLFVGVYDSVFKAGEEIDRYRKVNNRDRFHMIKQIQF